MNNATRIATAALTAIVGLSSHYSASANPKTAPAAKPATKSLTPLKDITSTDDLGRWVNDYYLHPSPELLPKAVKFVEKNKMASTHSRNILIAFFSQVIAKNPQYVPQWTDMFKTLDVPTKGLLWTAMWQANTPETNKLLPSLTSTLTNHEKEGVGKMGKPAPLEKMPIAGPANLDMLWACFSASGDERYVKRIIEVLPPPDTHGAQKVSGAVASDMIRAGAAKWSLTANAHQHTKVMTICQQVRQQTSNPIIKKELTEVIDKANKAPSKSK